MNLSELFHPAVVKWFAEHFAGPTPAQAPSHGAVWSPDQALVEILRGRLEGLGPITQTALATPLALGEAATATALAALIVVAIAVALVVVWFRVYIRF
jgi:hypothetical protein